MTAAMLLLQSTELGSGNSDALAYIKLLIVLALILGGAVFGVHVLLPRIGKMHRFASGPIQVAARLPLEPRRSLYVVKIGEEYFLVGTSEAGMQCLTPLKPESVEAALAGDGPPDREFSAVLQAFRRWKKAS